MHSLHGLRATLIEENHYCHLPQPTDADVRYARREPNLACSCDRIGCPVCLRKKRYWQRSALLHRVEVLGPHRLYKTLTIEPTLKPLVLEDLRGVVRELQTNTRTMLNDPLFRCSTGWFSALEVKASSRRLNPHSHLLLDCTSLSADALDYLRDKYLPSWNFHYEIPESTDHWCRYICKAGFDAVFEEFRCPALYLQVATELRGIPRFLSKGTLLCTGRHRAANLQ